MRIGFLGLGKMGKNMVLHLLEQGVEVVAWNRSPEPRQEVSKAGATAVENFQELISNLPAPRIIWFMLPAGELFDEKYTELKTLLSSGDLIIDGGNSFYKDSLRRGEQLKKDGFNFMDIGVSGGPGGARKGACLMVGGDSQDYQKIEPILKILASENALAHLGPVGAGHFAKMVHNGIEYGMMQAIAEGAAVLKASQFGFNLSQVFELYNRQSVITSRLVGWTKDAFDKDPNLENISSKIDHTGEGEWTIRTADELAIPVPVIKQSLQSRIESTSESENFRDKVVSAMRGEFGGHPVKKH